jgi:hypothetical protein
MMELSIAKDTLSRSITSLRQQAHTTAIEVERVDNLRLIREIAESELGMVKQEYIKHEYIAMSQQDVIEILTPENNTIVPMIAVAFTSMIDTLSRDIRGLFAD